jgi:hypothetical protein
VDRPGLHQVVYYSYCPPDVHVAKTLSIPPRRRQHGRILYRTGSVESKMNVDQAPSALKMKARDIPLFEVIHHKGQQ